MAATCCTETIKPMRKFFGFILMAVLGLTGGVTQQVRAQRVVADSLEVGGFMRHFQMFLPDNLPVQAPLVFVLHGYGSSAPVDTWMNDAAVKHDFALCVPKGLKDKTGKPGWNVRYPSQEGFEPDDVQTMVKLAKFVQKKYNLSKANTFLTGMSNGGDLCFLMNYQKQNAFRALASLAGITITWMREERVPTKPIPFMEIHGTKDALSTWEGDLGNTLGWGKYYGVLEAVSYIVEKNGCVALPTDTVKGKSFEKNGHMIVHHRYVNPKTHNDVWLYEVIGSGHNWFRADMDTGEEVWKFFSQYLKK